MAKKSKLDELEDSLFNQLSFFEPEQKAAPDLPKPKSMPSYQKGRLYRLEVAELLPDPSQPRKALDEEGLEELAGSISRHGLLEPVLFRQSEHGQLFVIAGSRRLAAARRAEIKQIPGLLADGDATEIALVENLVRQDLTSIEEAEAVERLKSRHSYTLAELAGIIGKSVPTISEIISLTRLPVTIRDDCRGDRRIARSILVEIAKLSSDAEMQAMYDRFRRDGLSRSAIRSKEGGKKERKSYIRLFRSYCSKITAIDPSTMNDKERKKIRNELEALRRSIDDRLEKLN
ncbi:putative chromosome-partitioning protein ParB [Geobacter sp. OR-1]|uniref:ParB/RepB/Spo0J family partition protein n=1 Tax=Geobacter sp. OR-1 TaxID=1266765 RepID=UPI0005436B6B|nr:ParB/RepB/Spo0J family partition protein [Geobacter sp. OR-1]GAM11545.1 putative chromosome-partitioning protein ParB [Geobacter sp. OR-1]